jgi:precorrin-3B C17-methyltransferase
MAGEVYVVGFGPGSPRLRTPEAVEAIRSADVVIGYKTYIELISDLLDGKEVISAGMREELRRARTAIELAREGRRVAVVSNGDPEIFGMAPLVLELASRLDEQVPIRVVPGVTAALAAGALLGAPLGSDFAVVNLSPLLTPPDAIMRRVRLAAAGDFVLALYNPVDGRLLREVLDVLRRARGGGTPVGIVRDAYRAGQRVVITTLDRVDASSVDMRTIIIVGNSETYVWRGFMITPRGYHRKYAYP